MLSCCRSLQIPALLTTFGSSHIVACVPSQLTRRKPLSVAGAAVRQITSHGAVAPAAAHQSYRTIAAPHNVTVEVKKSKFVTTAWPISHPEEALQLVAAASDPAASHNCWAYRIGDQHRGSDDGEPGGTAGAPILGAITGEDLDGVCVLVTRHFGGTKLGAGGLIRAYGGAARDCLRGAQHVTVQPLQRLRLELLVADIGIAYGQLDRFGAQRLEESYGEDGQRVALAVKLPVAEAADLRSALADASCGRIVCRDEQG